MNSLDWNGTIWKTLPITAGYKQTLNVRNLVSVKHTVSCVDYIQRKHWNILTCCKADILTIVGTNTVDSGRDSLLFGISAEHSDNHFFFYFIMFLISRFTLTVPGILVMITILIAFI